MAKMNCEMENGMEKNEYPGGAKAIRPQTPCDAYTPQEPWKPGMAPVGGFRSTFDFGYKGKTTTGVTPFQAPALKGKTPRGY
jgi:hypothetical protein